VHFVARKAEQLGDQIEVLGSAEKEKDTGVVGFHADESLSLRRWAEVVPHETPSGVADSR